MIRIAQAASSEIHTKANPGLYGTPPNQLRTGVTASKPEGNLDGELNVIPFYGSNWRSVFRCTDAKIAEKIAQNAYDMVANGSAIGYSQEVEGKYPRTGVFDALFSATDHNPRSIKALVNCDCSAMVGACVYFAGVYNPRLRVMNTTSEPRVLMDTGAFVEITDNVLLETATGCKRGDIFWRPGHTMVCLDSSEEQETIPKRIDYCSACNMRTGPSTDYSIIRTLHPGDIVTQISVSENGWNQVSAFGQIGFVSPKFIADLPTAYASGNVWMRKDAGKNYDGIIVIPLGAEVYLTGNTKKVLLTTWYECIYANKQGYASGMYIKPR